MVFSKNQKIKYLNPRKNDPIMHDSLKCVYDMGYAWLFD